MAIGAVACQIVDAPRLFALLYAALSPFVDPVTLAKVLRLCRSCSGTHAFALHILAQSKLVCTQWSSCT
jgi:hypothetical protein